jgi:predicted DNA-binding protein
VSGDETREFEGALVASLVVRFSSAALEAVKTLSQRTRVRQSVYLREAAEEVLERFEGVRALLAAEPGGKPWTEGTDSCHVLVTPEMRRRIKALAQRTEISQNDLLRGGLAVVLERHGAHWKEHVLPPRAALCPLRCTKDRCGGTAFSAATSADGRVWLQCIACTTPLGPFHAKESTE